jgi:hypothetical protein
MSINCTFHRSAVAHFQCHECGSTFCDECISVRDTEGYAGRNRDYFCPGCNLPAEMLSIGNIIEPFWGRLSAFFLYPLQLTPLFLTLFLAGFGALFPDNILVNLFVWVVMMKYAYATLIETGRGGLRAPPVTWDLINNDVLQVFKQYLIFALVGAATACIFQLTGIIGGSVFLILTVLAMPAIIMLLVATNSILHALNPVYFVGIIFRIGWPYFLQYLFLFFLLAGPAALFAYLPADILPYRLYIFLTLFLKQFYTLISYNLMGYVLLQYHKEIGYKVDYEYFMGQKEKKGKKKKQTPEDDLDKALVVLIKQGKYEEAIQRLIPFVQIDKPQLVYSEKFLQLLKMCGDQEQAIRYSLRHLDLLIAAGKKQKALDLFAEIRLDGTKVPAAESVIQVGAWYKERQEFKNGIATYIYFVKQFKDHLRQPEVYFELAKLLNERANNSTKARQILTAIVKKYPGHELLPQVREYLALVA